MLFGRRVSFEPVPDLPAQWSASVSDRLDEYGCPLLAGPYEMPPEVVVTAVGKAYARRMNVYGESPHIHGNEFDQYSLFIGPLRGEQIDSTESSQEPFLALDRTEPDALTLRGLTPDGAREVTYRLPIGQDGLQCIDGYYQLPPFEMFTVGEFTTLNGQRFRRFGTLTDGSLIYYLQFGPLKQVGSGKGEFTHRFYRFLPKKNAGDHGD